MKKKLKVKLSLRNLVVFELMIWYPVGIWIINLFEHVKRPQIAMKDDHMWGSMCDVTKFQ